MGIFQRQKSRIVYGFILGLLALSFWLSTRSGNTTWRRQSSSERTAIDSSESFQECCPGSTGAGSRRTLEPIQISSTYDENIAVQSVLRLHVVDEAQRRHIRALVKKQCLDVWEQNRDFVDVRILREMVPWLLAKNPGLDFSILIEDLQQSVVTPQAKRINSNSNSYTEKDRHDQKTSGQRSSAQKSSSPESFFSSYQPLPAIESWMHLLRSLFPTHTRIIKLGDTAEGRSISALRVGVHPKIDGKSQQQRGAIVIVGGIHGREWGTISTVSYIAHHFITSYGKSRSITSILQYLDVIFVPSLNPDGYAFTWDHDRFWQNNRQPTQSNSCIGFSIGSSFESDFDIDTTIEKNLCSEPFAADRAKCKIALEASSLAQWTMHGAQNGSSKILAFLNIHGYSSRISYPCTTSCQQISRESRDLQTMGNDMANVMYSSRAKRYQVEASCGASGDGASDMNSCDATINSTEGWFANKLGARYAYTLKLPDVDNNGFLMPASAIISTGKEVATAVEHLAVTLATKSTRNPGFG